MNSISETQLLSVAMHAARSAGEYVLANSVLRRGDVNRADKADVKHKLDVEAQALAMSIIRDAYPDHPILGEESCNDPLPEHDYLWIVDPIDGTINFFHGLPWWCCSIAVRYRGKPVAGAVFAPELGRMFSATAHGPACCNGQTIHVSETDDLALSAFATGASGFIKGQFSAGSIAEICRKIQRVRINGAAALDQCMVASGALEGYFEPGIFHWDFAAGSLIVERAGGRYTILKEYGGYRCAFLASNAKLHKTFTDFFISQTK